MQRKAGIPHAIGAIDGNHIPIKPPKEFSMSYYNRKEFYLIVLQVDIDSNGKFIDIFVGYPVQLMIVEYLEILHYIIYLVLLLVLLLQ